MLFICLFIFQLLFIYLFIHDKLKCQSNEKCNCLLLILLSLSEKEVLRGGCHIASNPFGSAC